MDVLVQWFSNYSSLWTLFKFPLRHRPWPWIPRLRTIALVNEIKTLDPLHCPIEEVSSESGISVYKYGIPQVERSPDLKIGCQSKEEEAHMCRKCGKEVFVIWSEREQVSVMEIQPAPAPSCPLQYYSTAGKGDIIFKVHSKHSWDSS